MEMERARVRGESRRAKKEPWVRAGLLSMLSDDFLFPSFPSFPLLSFRFFSPVPSLLHVRVH